MNSLAEFGRSLRPTKRNFLRLTTKLFDPTGLLSPIVFLLKVLFQATCVCNYKWDDELTGEHLRIWNQWITNLETCNVMKVPRFYFHDLPELADFNTLHAFGDASKQGYAAAIYLVSEFQDNYSLRSVAAKTRVAPLEKLTTPCLELLAALIVARLINTVQTALSNILEIREKECWTDSKCALYWITNGKQHKQYVQNRVDQILDLTEGQERYHCPGPENPSDIGSRGAIPSELLNNILWWRGPPG